MTSSTTPCGTRTARRTHRSSTWASERPGNDRCPRPPCRGRLLRHMEAEMKENNTDFIPTATTPLSASALFRHEGETLPVIAPAATGLVVAGSNDAAAQPVPDSVLV